MLRFEHLSLVCLLRPSVTFTPAYWANVSQEGEERTRDREREREKPLHSVDSWECAKDPEFHMPHIRFQLSLNPILNPKAFLPLKRAFLLTA